MHYILYSFARILQAVVFFARFWRFGPNSSLLRFRIVESRSQTGLFMRLFPGRRRIYVLYLLCNLLRTILFSPFIARSAADKWRFFTKKFYRPLFPIPAKWRFFTGKTGKFSFFPLSPPRFGACAARTAGNFRASCRFFREKTHVAI